MVDYLQEQVKYGYYDFLNDPEYIALVKKHIDQIGEQYNLTGLGVSIISTSVPFTWCKLLSDAGCSVKVFSYHPLVIQNKEVYECLNNVQIIESNIFIDDLTEQLMDSEVVIYPDYEYYIPLTDVNYSVEGLAVFVVNCLKDKQSDLELSLIHI